MKLRSKKGFSLVELIIVIAIMGVIAAVAVPSLTTVQASSKVSADYTSAQEIGNAVRIWLTDATTAQYTTRTTQISKGYVEMSTITDLAKYIDINEKPQGLNGSNYYINWNSKSGKISIAIAAGAKAPSVPTKEAMSYGIDKDNVVTAGVVYIENVAVEPYTEIPATAY